MMICNNSQTYSTGFYRNASVLVAGGTGFVGSHLVEALLAAGAKVRVPVHQQAVRVGAGLVEEIAADLACYEDCLAAVDGIDYVFHAAGSVGAAGIAPSDQMTMINQGLLLTGNLMQACWQTGVQRLLIYSSSTVYPDVQHQVSEEEIWNGPPHPAYLGYGWMRRYMEKLAEFVVSRSPLQIAIARPTAVYGERDDSQHVLPSLIRRALAKESPFIVWGDGYEARDFLHAADLARASLLLLEKHATCDPVNIGAGATCTIREILSLILEVTGYTDCQLQFDLSKPSTIPFRGVSIKKAKELLDFSPTVSIREGIGRAVAYYQGLLP